MLVTLDVQALFANTPQEECAQATEETLSEEPHEKTPTNFLLRILKVIQELHIVEFNGELWKQLIGSDWDNTMFLYVKIFIWQKKFI